MIDFILLIIQLFILLFEDFGELIQFFGEFLSFSLWSLILHFYHFTTVHEEFLGFLFVLLVVIKCGVVKLFISLEILIRYIFLSVRIIERYLKVFNFVCIFINFLKRMLLTILWLHMPFFIPLETRKIDPLFFHIF